MSEVIRIFTGGQRRLRTVLPTSAWILEDQKTVEAFGVLDSKRSSQRKVDSLLVVRPSSPTYVLSGRTLLTFAWGRRLMALRWPFLLAAVGGRVIMVLLRHTELLTESHVCLGLGGQEVRVPVQLASGHALDALCAACYLVELFLMMHVVHWQLLQLTWSSFDPWVITLCMLRALASFLFSRGELLGTSVLEPHDIGYMVVCVLWTLLIVMLEAAELCRPDKVVMLLTNCVLCASLLLHTILQQEPVHWDPDARISIWWLAPMTFQSQFISAMLSVGIYLGKAVLNFIVRGRSFMFLRAHYALDVNRVEELFVHMDVDGDGEISSQDWQCSLSALGIPQSHLMAGFKQLDEDGCGMLSYDSFRRFLGECCELNPGIGQLQHLALFCQEAWSKASGTVSLERMIEAVASQWQQVQLQPFSEDFYGRLLRNEDVKCLLQAQGGRGSAIMLPAVVGIALQRLGKLDFLRLESDMLQLGMRHAKDGITLSMLSTFQEALLATLRSQLGESFLEHEWAFLWMHFITRPFLHGLARASNLTRRGILRVALGDAWPDASPRGTRPPPQHSVLPEVLRSLDEELQRINSHIVDTDGSAAQSGFPTGLLKGVLQELVKGDVQHARTVVRKAAAVHFECDLTAFDLARFQEGFLRAVRHVLKGQEGYSKQLEAWTWVFQLEIIEVFLMTPVVEIEDTLDNLPVEDPTAELDAEQWQSLMNDFSVPEDLAMAVFGKLRCVSPFPITFECVKAALLGDCMINPGRTCTQVVLDWCRANT